jgi:hypothetical protein
MMVLTAWWDVHLGDARRARLRRGLETADMVMWMVSATITAVVVAGRTFPRGLALIREDQHEDLCPYLKCCSLKSPGRDGQGIQEKGMQHLTIKAADLLFNTIGMGSGLHINIYGCSIRITRRSVCSEEVADRGQMNNL